jgi:4-alpha-glucanotransferase
MIDALLDRLARERGISDTYQNYRGEPRSISRATKAGILEVMGCAVGDVVALERGLDQLEAERWSALLPPVAVLGPARTGVLVTAPIDSMQESLQWHVALADGATITGHVRGAELEEFERREIRGRWYTRRLLVLPDNLPQGYHSLDVHLAGAASAECSLIVAPGYCHEPDLLTRGGRLWGVAVQLYTLRTARNWGIGDFADLETVVRQCAAQGAAFVGLNPLHALFPANPWHCSPYSPSSRLFLNISYIAPENVPEYAECEPARHRAEEAGFQAELAQLRATQLVDYAGVAAAKMPLLRMLFEHFRREHVAPGSARAAAFGKFIANRGEPLRLHALHDAIDAYLRSLDRERFWGWPVWPEHLRDPAHAGVAEFAVVHAESVEFHSWLQWIADEQLGHVQRLARELGMPIGLYGDCAVGVNPSGSETWSDQAVYRTGAAIGAPPDALALKGQDWGLLPYDPHALMIERYRPFRDLVQANMRHFGALRLDHIMALSRQWWVPAGFGAAEGGYVSYPLADLMSILTLESREHACLVVGEDLGTVPDDMIHAMAERAVYSYKVLLFEKDTDGRFRSPAEYLRRAMAAVTTHDLPTLRSYWKGSDLELRNRLGLYPNDAVRNFVYEERALDRKRLIAALNSAGVGPLDLALGAAGWDDQLSDAIHLYLARSTAALVVLQIEDLIGMNDPVNVPGTNDEHANWQRKVSVTLDEVFCNERVGLLLGAVRQARVGC